MSVFCIQGKEKARATRIHQRRRPTRMDLKEEDILGEQIGEHWYYRSKAAAVRHFLANKQFRNLLDVGAGSGFFSKDLLMKYPIESATCVDTGYREDHEEWVNGKCVHFKKSCGETDTDLVLMMDVLEHVDDDRSLLKDYVDKVPSGTFFLITVPAFSFLWSDHDVFLGHRRRYTLGQIEQVISDSKLSLVGGAYFFGLVFPIAAFVRLLPKLRTQNNRSAKSSLVRHNAFSNWLLALLCKLELPLFPYNRIAGLSVFCLARKP